MSLCTPENSAIQKLSIIIINNNNNKPHGFCGRKGNIELINQKGPNRKQELCEGRGGRPRLGAGYPSVNSPYGLCGRKGTLNQPIKRARTDFRSCVKEEVDVLDSGLATRP